MVTPCLAIVVSYLTTGPEQPSDAHIMAGDRLTDSLVIETSKACSQVFKRCLNVADIGKRKREDEEVPPADLEEVKKVSS